MKRVRCLWAIWAAVGLGAQVVCGEAATTRPGLPFTISKETTVITEPLRKDGTPDYVAALNKVFGSGVSPEENGFVAWLEIMGTEKMLDARTRAEVLALSGAKETSAKYQPVREFVLKTLRKDEATAEKLSSAIEEAGRRVWREEELAEVAAYIKAQEEALNQMNAAAKRAKWWAPYVSPDGSVMYMLIANAGGTREAAQVLAARALRRLEGGEAAGFTEDIRTIRVIGGWWQNTGSMIEQLMALRIYETADRAVSAAVLSGKLRAEHVKQLEAMYGAARPRAALLKAFDVCERYSLADSMVFLATGKKAWGNELLEQVKAAEVEWDLVLKYHDGIMDEYVKMAGEPDVRKLFAASAALQKRLNEAAGDSRDLRKNRSETRGDYTKRFAAYSALVLVPDVTRPLAIERRTMLKHDMVVTLLAANRYKLDQGEWPKRLEDLVPGYIAAVPTDVFSDGGKDAVKYVVTKEGPAIYSVGFRRLTDKNLEKKIDPQAVVGAKGE